MVPKAGFPDRKLSPNFYHWFIIMKQFSASTLRKWVTDEVYLDEEDSLIAEFIHLYPFKKDSAIEPSEQSPDRQGSKG